MTNLSDIELLQKIRNGEDYYFNLLFRKYYSKLYYFAIEFVKDEFEVESIVQNAFIKVWEKRHDLNDNSNLNAYLHTIVKNACLKYLNQQAKHRSVPLEEEAVQREIYALSQFESEKLSIGEITEKITTVLSSLSPRCKEIFLKSKRDNLKNKEIAEDLNISIKSVEANITRAKKSIKSQIVQKLALLLFLIDQMADFLF
ncbi:RNA polymerase sigma-70 factor [Persicobacter psychrovividus]|uniref:DNA-directed RNA polymerase sigma-70 factor n=1 Tax=Persicobacter psychrovividus TaxID=387638 RepID=A0ABM7VIM5_9BACT|nr:DNA-directed RNA polymerase sigma-70 factor [Persicobacter psychrovividus]